MVYPRRLRMVIQEFLLLTLKEEKNDLAHSLLFFTWSMSCCTTLHSAYFTPFHKYITARRQLACSRLRDGGGKSFSNIIRNAKNAQGLGRDSVTAPFPKSGASYFRFARFNTFPLYYMRAWHRLDDNEIRTLQLLCNMRCSK